MTSISRPDYYCNIDLSEVEFNEISGIDWVIEIFSTATKKPIKEMLVIPEGAGYTNDIYTEAWLWIDSSAATLRRNSSVLVKLITIANTFEADIDQRLIFKLSNKNFKLRLTGE
jgi:hypothetical protein